MRLRPSLAWLILAALAIPACAVTTRPIALDGRPFTPEADEAALWSEATREAGGLRQRVRLYVDPELSAYLLGLSQAPVLGAGGPELRVEIVRDPTLNAFALPDGRLIVHTGLLAVAETPEDLGVILAREVAHVTQRHALGVARAGGLRPVPAGDRGVLSPVAGVILGQRLALAATAAITGYGEAGEREADEIAINRLRSAGRDVGRAAAIYDRLAGHSVVRGPLEVFLLGRTLWLQERRESMQRLVAGPSGTTAAGQDEFDRRLRPVVRENALEDIRQGRFVLARQALDRVLKGDGADAVAHVYYGDLLRLQSQWLVSGQGFRFQVRLARHAYTRALELDPSLADAYRQLGLLHYQLKDVAEARTAFERYLSLAPGAPDAGRVAGYVRELSR